MSASDRIHVASQTLVDLAAELQRDVEDELDWDRETRDEHVGRLVSLVAALSESMR